MLRACDETRFNERSCAEPQDEGGETVGAVKEADLEAAAFEDVGYEDDDESEMLEGTETHRRVVDDGGARLDVWLAETARISRNQVQKLIRSGLVTVNGLPATARTAVRKGQEIVWKLEPAQLLELCPENIPLDIVYQDAEIIVLNKQRGIVVHPAAGHATGTLVHALLYHCRDLQAISGTIRPGIVHRLDKDTTGLLVVAKNELAMASLSQQIKERRMERLYMALVWGNVHEDSGSIDLPIARHPRDRKRMAVVASGRIARTDYHVLERFGKWTLLRLKLHSGRTHQIRVHLSHKGYPIVGDMVYGPRAHKFAIEAQALHAFRLCLDHPRDEKRLCFAATIPKDFSEVLAFLRRTTVHNKS